MFSTGQWIFASLFLIAFSFIIFRSYQKDKKLHSRNYKGVGWVGLIIVLFVIILFIIKNILKNQQPF